MGEMFRMFSIMTLFAGIAFMAGGIVFIWMAIMRIKLRRRLQAAGGRTTATVAGVDERSEWVNDTDGSRLQKEFTYMLEYAVNEQSYRERYTYGLPFRRFQEGDSVPLLYDPENPEVFLVECDIFAKIWPFGAPAMGSAFTITAITMLAKMF